MANYVATNGSTASGGTQQATTSAFGGNGSALAVIASTNAGAATTFRRGKVYDLLVGTNGTPGDTVVEFEILRTTTMSSATVQASALDPADAAAVTLSVANSTSAATTTVPAIWYIGMNQRASYRWVCAPGSELVWPATTSNGLHLYFRSPSYTSTVTATWFFQEQ